MKYAASLIAVGAGAVSAFPNAPVPRANQPSWSPPGPNDVRAPCPGLNTLANHNFLPHNGRNITVDMMVKAFKDGFNMGEDIIRSSGGSALAVCVQVTGNKDCQAIDLNMLNTPHSFEHDNSLTRQDYNNGKGNNHDFNQEVFDTVLKVWEDTDIIDFSYANAAHLMRVADCKKADDAGWFQESDAVSASEIAFMMGTMGTPQNGNARKDWVKYWFSHERMPFELGWAPDQRPEHNQSTVSDLTSRILNAPPVAKKSTSSSSSTPSGTAPAKGTDKPSGTAPAKGTDKPSGTAPAKVSDKPSGSDKPSERPTPSGFASFSGNATTGKPQTTTFLSTSIAYATTEITVTSCAPEVTNCPAESKKPMVITKTLSQYTTVCPVTATVVPTGGLVPAPAPAPSKSTASAESVSLNYPTASITLVSGNIVQPSSTPAPTKGPESQAASSQGAAPPATTPAPQIPNPYFASLPASAFPSVPPSVISEYHASTGAYAAPSLAPEYTQSGSQAIAAATSAAAPYVTDAPGAPGAPAPAGAGATNTPPAPAAPAPGVYGGGKASGTGSLAPSSTATGAPIATGGASSGKAVSGLLAGAAVAAMLL